VPTREKEPIVMKDIEAVDKEPVDVQHTNKRKRGRPRKDGMKSLDAFGRALWGLHWFNKARSRNEKYEAALQIAARKIRSSVAEMKRILAEFQPKGAKWRYVIRVRSLSPAEAERNRLLDLPEEYWKNPKLKSISLGIQRIRRPRRAKLRKRILKKPTLK
jgi:hypothetical protein